MTFLDPVSGLVAGSIAVPLLIALYMLKLRRKPLRVSSTLLWEQAASDMQANVPLRWLKMSWTLLLQLLALVCLLLALARPAVEAAAGPAQRVVIVIDRSASMSATDVAQPTGSDKDSAPVTRLDVAKRLAGEFIDALSRSSTPGGGRPSAMVVELGAAPRVVQGFTDDRRALRDAVASVEPSDQTADLAPLLPLLRGVLGTMGEDEPLSSELVMFSDGGLEAVSRTGLPRSTRVSLVPTRETDDAGGPDNLGIVAMSARRDSTSPSTVRVFVRVQNSAHVPREVSLLAAIDGRTVNTIPLSLPAATSATATSTAALGEAAATLELTIPGDALLTVTIPREDALASDNTAGVYLPPVRPARVLVVGPGLEADPYAALRGEHGVDRFLLGVLTSLDLGVLRVTDAAAYKRTISSETTTPFDLVIFDRVMPRALPMQPTLTFGAGLPVPGLTVSSVAEADIERATTRLLSWRRTHPALRNAGLQSLMASPPMVMTIDEAGAENQNEPRASVTALAFGAGGPLIAEVAGPGAGAPRRVVVAMDLLLTNWGSDYSFPVFVASAIEYLTGRGDAASGRSATTSEPVSVHAMPGASRVTYSGPMTGDLVISKADDMASLGVPVRVGTYTFTNAMPNERTLPVNLLSPLESSLRTASNAEVLFGGPLSGGGRQGQTSTLTDQEPGRREVWHWFTLIAMALLTAEWFVYAWRMRA